MEQNRTRQAAGDWARVERKLIASKQDLIRNGSVIARLLPSGSRVWTLRFRTYANGKSTHRSIYLGGHGEDAHELLAQWRREAIPAQNRLKDDVLRTLPRQARISGLSRRGQHRLRQLVLDGSNNPVALAAFGMGFLPIDNPIVRFGKRRGRPRRSSLWR